jgi:hypothetical protein
MAKDKEPDWERIEADYRAGLLSLREIASADGCVTEGAIRKRAKRDQWTRDLNARIQARADALVRNESSAADERQIIEANAQRIAQVRGEHRSDIARARGLVVGMLGELEAETTKAKAKPDHQVMALTARVTTVKTLAEALKTLIGLEREAYSIGVQMGSSAQPAADLTPSNQMAREFAYALHLGLKSVGTPAPSANSPVPNPRQAAS